MAKKKTVKKEAAKESIKPGVVKEPPVLDKNSEVVFTVNINVKTIQKFKSVVDDRIQAAIKELDRGLAATTLEVENVQP